VVPTRVRDREQLRWHAERLLQVLEDFDRRLAIRRDLQVLAVHLERQKAVVLEVGRLERFGERELGDERRSHAGREGTPRASSLVHLAEGPTACCARGWLHTARRASPRDRTTCTIRSRELCNHTVRGSCAKEPLPSGVGTRPESGQ